MALTKISRGLLSTGVSDSSDATAITIDSDERVIIGHTTALDDIRSTDPYLQVLGSGLDTAHIGIVRFSDSVNGAHLSIGKSRSGTVGTNTIVQDGDKIGTLNFVGADGTNYLEGAVIEAVINGTPGTNDLPTALTFQTTANGASSSTERMRIDSSGNLLVGTTNSDPKASNVSGVQISGTTMQVSTSGTAMFLNKTSGDGVLLSFRKANSVVGSISTNANSLPSDKNFKRNISDLDLGLNLVTKLKPSQYNYKVDNEDSPRMYGLIAQDLEESLTEVGIEKNSTWLLQHEPNDDEKQSDYSLDYGKLTPILIKAIQEQQTQIEALQSEINTLKGGD